MDTPVWYQAPLFRTLAAPQRERLARIVTTRTLEPEAMLFMEQDPCTGFYVLVEGAIQLTRSSSVPGAHPTLAVVTPVNSFAEAALFGGEAFPATATAVKPSRVVHFPKAAFLGAMREDPDLALAIIHAQTLWLRRLIQKVEQLTASDSSDRLRSWVEEYVPRGGSFVLPVTKKTLAAQLGMTPETLSRGLRSMQDEGLLEVKGRVLRRGRS
ncbi:Crp/Fnr family transcriptional regulator [Mesoterricola sediminis]|uniref:Crp/Fnr family transcriptional regulator n=1 Tax=Mesoterricola sediminis TaxID=2927980 RepID=A0AA48H6G0_9BACT|nr:Crp/Fnr family transcriptional regulator [Mesoterricola sediminis]BDU78241.1 Crp/Fnr family transcriptional regulator [Mesoterricola sediminis]